MAPTKVPMGHDKHDEAPSEFMTKPSGQNAHVLAPSDEEKVPMGHLLQRSKPEPGAKVPGKEKYTETDGPRK